MKFLRPKIATCSSSSSCSSLRQKNYMSAALASYRLAALKTHYPKARLSRLCQCLYATFFFMSKTHVRSKLKQAQPIRYLETKISMNIFKTILPSIIDGKLQVSNVKFHGLELGYLFTFGQTRSVLIHTHWHEHGCGISWCFF